MTWITTIAVLIVLGAVGVWLMKPAPAAANEPLTQEMLRALLETLLYQGQQGGVLSIRENTGLAELRFEKYVRHGPEAGLRAVSESQLLEPGKFDAFIDELQTRDINHEVNPARDRVIVDFAQDVGLAHFVASILFERVAGIRMDRSCAGYFNNRVLTVNVPALTGLRRP